MLAPGRKAPPHARGWTASHGCPRCHHDGSPARAGMDRYDATDLAFCDGLPRTRGDGPLMNIKQLGADVAPPHARGWTPGPCLSSAPVRGSPARAGMDPHAKDPWRDRGRLPRTRGDGPRPATVLTEGQMAPPHARGWTSPAARWFCQLPGSPARAGMDPSFGYGISRVRRLPRTRGDGPCTDLEWVASRWTPSYARGWTCLQERRRFASGGSPRTSGDCLPIVEPLSDLPRHQPLSAAPAGLSRSRPEPG
ncbi:hypothetical protein BSY19_4787 (plasmid) [Bosea sp. RAC05]|nr:hypothetical protein BSY19_4787 [Bosea sp. RAC05]